MQAQEPSRESSGGEHPTPPEGLARQQELPPMISYAQNFEDVLLRRALSDVKAGFYVDVGAFHPVVDNVTNWFYIQGWHGINVEPNPQFFALVDAQRTRDTNLPFAVSGESGRIRLHLMDGLSTTVEEVAETHAQKGVAAERSVEVQAISLHDLFAEYLDGRVPDFLKIDTEGAEAAILTAYDFKEVRPRILVVEATEADTVEPAYLDWEGHVLACGYGYAYFDGLNRYYVRDEDSWRKDLFSAPPNVFDNYRLLPTDRRVDMMGEVYHPEDGSYGASLLGLLTHRDALMREAVTLRDQIAALHAENSRIATERDALDNDRNVLVLRASAFDSDVQDLLKENSRLAAERDALENERNILALRSSAYEKDVQTLLRESRRLAEDRDSFASEAASDRDRFASERNALALKAATISAERDRLTAENQHLTVAHDRLTLDAARLKVKLAGLRDAGQRPERSLGTIQPAA